MSRRPAPAGVDPGAVQARLNLLIDGFILVRRRYPLLKAIFRAGEALEEVAGSLDQDRATANQDYGGTLEARTSNLPMFGGCDNNSPALAISAAASRPPRCAWREASSGNVSKIAEPRESRALVLNELQTSL